MKDINSLITIGITTRNRQFDLNETLLKLVSLGLNDLPIIIYDDASDEPIASKSVLSQFKYLKMIRNENNKGLIFNRNRMAEITSTPYFISLDDDSCFADEPLLEEAIEYLEKYTYVAALEFQNIDINTPRKSSSLSGECALRHCAVKSYTGCGHMLRLSTFLHLGGYRELLFQMAEESDFAQKAWGAGFEVHSFPQIVVHHRRTPIARLPKRVVFYSVRNIALLHILNKPLLVGIIRAAGVYPFQLIFHRHNPQMFLKITLGWLSAFWCALISWNDRTPMSWGQYFRYQSLPQFRQPSESKN